MSRLKSIFISVYLMLTAFITYLGISHYLSTSANAWLFLAVLGFMPTALVGSFFIYKRARTKGNLPIFSSVLTVVAASFALTAQQLPMNAWIWAGVAYLGWGAYIFWYSIFPSRSSTVLQEGKVLPNLSLVNEHGSTVMTNDLKGSSSIILFFRGNWCPLCMAQIEEIANQYQEISNRGAKTVLISPQPQQHTKSLAKKFKVPFLFWRDENLAVAKSLEIFHEGGTPFGMEVFGYKSDTIMPTVIITDKNNEVIYLDMTDNYRVRPEPETFLKVLDGELV